MPLSIIRNDITKVKADAIVNTANPKPTIGAGTDKAIYDAAGADQLLEARKKIGSIKQGEAYVTPAFDLKATFIIHTVGPVWENGEAGECDVLKSCYLNSLELAYQYKCKSIAFPLISSGVYGFPKDVAIDIAEKAINEFLEDHDMKVSLVIFDGESLKASKGKFSKIKELVDDEYVKAQEEIEFNIGRQLQNRPDKTRIELETLEIEYSKLHRIDKDTFMKRRQEIMEARGNLKGIVGREQKNFPDKLLEIMLAKDISPTRIYKDYFDRRIFSKIQSVKNYHPSKGIAIQCCLGLQLTLTEACGLLASASYSFNPEFDPDIVIMYCIVNKIWRMLDINNELSKYGLPDFDEIY